MSTGNRNQLVKSYLYYNVNYQIYI